MNERYDVDRTGREDGGGTALDVRSLLEEASWPGQQEALDPHEHWTSGRRRRSRKRAGAGLLGGVALVAVAGLVRQAGVFGGEVGPLEPHVATLPSGLTTFVLAAPDAPDVDPNTISALRVATEQDLNDTSWTLLDDMWGTGRSAPDVVGSDAETIFSFPDPAITAGWGFLADGCGGGWFQDGLSLTTEGAFDGGGSLATDDQGCLEPAQTAEDFWLDVLPSGGTLHLLGGHWLLLSVDTSQAGVEQPPPVTVEDATRLVFVRSGINPEQVDLAGQERAPSNEDLAGSRWQLVDSGEGEPGAAALSPWLEGPADLGLWFADGWPSSLSLVYGEECQLAQLRTEGVNALGATVPVEGLSPLAEEGPQTCAGAEEAAPVLAQSLERGVQVTLVADDALLMRIALPSGEEETTEDTVTGTAPPVTGEASPEPGESPSAAPTPPAVAPTVPTTAPTTPPASPTGPATPTGPSTPPASTAPDDGPAFMDPDEQWIGQPWPASGGGIFAPSVRAGTHDGFDRIVLDLAGEPGASGPGWYAVYTPNPLRDGSGLPMQIAGDSVLEIVLNNMAYPEPGDPVYDAGDFGLDTHRLDAVEEVIRTTPWEGQIQLFIGMQGEPRPYRVFLLQDPLRLVVDVEVRN